MAEAAGDTKPFARFEWTIAGRYLRARRREGFISVIALFSFLGIMLGVATLIVVMAVMNGFRAELLDKILGFSGHVTILARERGPIPSYEEMTKRLLAVPGVVQAIPFVEGQVLASSPRASTGALVRGVRGADLKMLKGINNEKLITAIAVPGTPDEKPALDGYDKSGGVAVGRRLADEHLLGLGSTLTIVSPEGPETVMGTAPRLRDFPVVAIFEIGLSNYDESIVYMPIEDAKEFFVSEEGVSAIELMLDDPDGVDEAVAAIEDAAGPDARAYTWKGRNQTFFTALAVERNVMFTILALIILVAALNIVSGLIMLVKDKGHDIAILRTMGATAGTVMRVFFITGAAIGVTGTIAGFVLGLVLALNIQTLQDIVSWATGTDVFNPLVYYLTRLPAKLDVSQTAWVMTMALALSFLATLYPAWRAAKLDPVEALRYE